MTGADHSEVDLDRLADYAAGVLDRAEAAEVSRLIAAVPAWADAYLGLVAADAMTRAELRAEARSQIEPMPADVFARIEAALRAEPPTSLPGALPGAPIASPAPVGERPAVRRHTLVERDRARRRRRFATGLVAAAAGVVALVGGVSVVTSLDSGVSGTGGAGYAGQADSANQESTRGGDSGAPVPAGASAASGPPEIASGTDYTRATLASVVQRAGFALNAGSPHPTYLSDVPELPPGDTTAKNARQSCLAAVGRDHPGTVILIDDARFNGEPARILLIEGSTGRIAVAVGPACGATGSDEKAAVQLS